MNPKIREALEALLDYEQADADGVMVLASRQAIHEVADELGRLRAEVEDLRGQLKVDEEAPLPWEKLKQLEEYVKLKKETEALRAEVERLTSHIEQLTFDIKASESNAAALAKYGDALRDWQRRARLWMVRLGPGMKPATFANMRDYNHQCVLFEQERKELIAEAEANERST